MDETMRDLQHVLSMHGDSIMKLAHVVGVGIGEKYVDGRNTHQACITVFVDKKIITSALAPEDRIPEELEGCVVDVVESGVFKIL